MARSRRGSIKSVVLAMIFCGGGLVAGGYFLKGDSSGEPTADPLKWAQDQAQTALALAQAEEGGDLPAGKAEPKTPTKAKAETTKNTAPAKGEPADAPKTDAPKTEAPKADAPKTKADPAKGTAAKGDAAQYTPEQKALLDEIRQSMSSRDLPGAKAAIEKAEKLEGDDAFKKEIARLKIYHDHLVQFWTAVDKGGQIVHTKDEITIGTTICSVVEYGNETLIIRVDGLNKRYHLKDMGLKMALVLASHALKVDAPVNKVIVASFLAMDVKGDREQARKYFDEGKKAGLDVEDLLPELGVTGPKQLNVPSNLPPALKAQLTPANWLLRKAGKNGKIARGPIAAVGRTSPNGQLILIYDPSQTDPAWAVQRQRINGDFKFRMIIDDAKDGQVVGLYSADDKDQGFFAPLPAGVVHLEFSRKKDVIECSVNGSPVEVQKTEGTPANMPGMAGLSLPPGTNCLLAYFEFVK
jgi:hypothetical protein